MLITLCAYYFSRFIRTNSIIIFIFALLLSAITILVPNSIVTTFIANGTIGVTFLLIVMFTGALKKGSKIKKQLSSVRNEYAILGFIFITPHAYLYIYESIVNQIPLEIMGILIYILLLPLFVTSFKLIRNNIPTSSWLKLHRLSYFAYLLIFLHSIRVTEFRHIIAYSILFGTYSIIKLNNYFEKHSIIKATAITLVVTTGSIFLITDFDSYLNVPYNIMEGNEFEDGTYIGYSKGFHNSDTVVRVQIENNQIKYVFIEDCGCTPNVDQDKYFDVAFDIANEIKDENRTDIDAISGATKTSIAVNNAVIDALEHALVK
jgi:DMSO/TMAO reductase YedYZ heme-binding membrane subunit/uncharacterized protein with FMN-binding domain